MVYAKLEGKEKARADSMKCLDELEARFATNIAALVAEVDTFIKSITPVNTGQAVRNYIWTRDAPNSIVYDAIDNGDPGRTNAMALGSEPRRPPNEAAAYETLAGLNIGTNPFGAIYLTNLSPDIEGLELGIYPGPPLKSRSPQGMFGITAAYVKTKIEAKGILS